MDHALCKQRKKAIFVEWFTVGCQIYMSREDAGGVVSRKEKKIASVKVWKKDCKWEREKCKYSLWWVVALQPLQTGMRLLQLREQETFSICFDKHVGGIAIPRAALLHKTQSDPCWTVGFAWIPLRHRRLTFTRIVISFYITVASCLFVLMRLLRNCPQGHGAAGWSLERWGDFIMEEIHISIWRKREREREGETRVPSAPYACLCLTCMAPH